MHVLCAIISGSSSGRSGEGQPQLFIIAQLQLCRVKCAQITTEPAAMMIWTVILLILTTKDQDKDTMQVWE